MSCGFFFVKDVEEMEPVISYFDWVSRTGVISRLCHNAETLEGLLWIQFSLVLQNNHSGCNVVGGFLDLCV